MADEQIAQAAGFGMVANVVETPYMDDYNCPSIGQEACRLDGTANKNIRTNDGNDEEHHQASNIQHTCI